MGKFNNIIYHAVAKCKDCDWIEEDYLKNVPDLAMEHSRNTKHKVDITVSSVIEFL